MTILSTLSTLGFLRMGLLLLGILLALVAPEANVETVLEWPRIIPTLIAPAIAPLLITVIFLDTLMAKIFLASATSQQSKQKYKSVIFINLVVVMLIIVAWFDFFASLGNR